MSEFLDRHGWSVVAPVSRDGSTRRYFRVEKNGRRAMFMDASAEAAPGHDLSDFIRIGTWLNEVGLKTPEIYEADEPAGFLLLEDFGESDFKKAIDKGRDEEELYTLAADVLVHLGAQESLPELPDYYQSHVHKNHRYVVDYYLPALGKENGEDIAAEYLAVWDEIDSALPPCPQGFLHIDFHAENLMFLPQEQGLKRCGILDFQGAMKGPPPYDLGNLLEDARREVPVEIRQEILGRQDENFRSWTRVLTTQFHCRVIGQFIKMALEDGQDGYMGYVPRVSSYIRAALEDPALKPLSSWFAGQGITFEESLAIDPAALPGQARG